MEVGEPPPTGTAVGLSHYVAEATLAMKTPRSTMDPGYTEYKQEQPIHPKYTSCFRVSPARGDWGVSQTRRHLKCDITILGLAAGSPVRGA